MLSLTARFRPALRERSSSRNPGSSWASPAARARTRRPAHAIVVGRVPGLSPPVAYPCADDSRKYRAFELVFLRLIRGRAHRQATGSAAGAWRSVRALPHVAAWSDVIERMRAAWHGRARAAGPLVAHLAPYRGANRATVARLAGYRPATRSTVEPRAPTRRPRGTRRAHCGPSCSFPSRTSAPRSYPRSRRRGEHRRQLAPSRARAGASRASG